MCIFVPKDATPEQRASLEAFGRAQGDAMGAALDKWTPEDWAALERLIAEDDAEEVERLSRK